MPRYSVRLYSTYVDEYEVEATSAEEAVELADAYQDQADTPSCMRNEAAYAALAAKVEQCAKHEYVDSEHPCVNELDADGNWIE